MKVLFIGNSFSQDATVYLRRVADDNIYVRNLYIGGCPLEWHADNIKGNKDAYDYQIDGEGIRKASINATLTEEKWDYVSIQQVSHYSGMLETYEPYTEYVVGYIKEKCPDAKIVFHRTWAYDDASTHGGFANYDWNRTKMYNCIVEASSKIAEKYSLPIIPSGDAIERARYIPEFDTSKGGMSLNRDGFHLSLDYGRYLAALTCYRFFTGKDATEVTFEPENTDPALCLKLKKLVNELL